MGGILAALPGSETTRFDGPAWASVRCGNHLIGRDVRGPRATENGMIPRYRRVSPTVGQLAGVPHRNNACAKGFSLPILANPLFFLGLLSWHAN